MSGPKTDKHPAGTQADPKIVSAVKTHIKNAEISCAAAHKVAEKLNVDPLSVGTTLDLTDVRIVKCQLGLFGYTPTKKIVEPAESVAEELEQSIQSKCTDNRITCTDCWQIAAARGIPRMDIAAACEALQLKIKPCQLGAF